MRPIGPPPLWSRAALGAAIGAGAAALSAAPLAGTPGAASAAALLALAAAPVLSAGDLAAAGPGSPRLLVLAPGAAGGAALAAGLIGASTVAYRPLPVGALLGVAVAGALLSAAARALCRLLLAVRLPARAAVPLAALPAAALLVAPLLVAAIDPLHEVGARGVAWMVRTSPLTALPAALEGIDALKREPLYTLCTYTQRAPYLLPDPWGFARAIAWPLSLPLLVLGVAIGPARRGPC